MATVLARASCRAQLRVVGRPRWQGILPLFGDSSEPRARPSLRRRLRRAGRPGHFRTTLQSTDNTRLEIVPDRQIAAFGAMRPQPLLAATDFERASVQVKLVE